LRVSDIEVKLIDSMGTDLSVVNAARVSFDKESDWSYDDVHDEDEHGDYVVVDRHPYLKESDTKLINYLAKHKHYSPFNHTFLTFRVKAPIFVARQLVKHEYLPWNEVSRRYVDSEPEFYIPPMLRAKADNVKQGSSTEAVTDREDGTWTDWLAYQVTKSALHAYYEMLKAGICPEQARMVLPQNVMTEWIWSGTLKAFHKMLSLRLDSHTQHETRIVAEKILPLIEERFPVSIKALLNANQALMENN
jgi:thymidylate synthase (FAD)